MRHDGLHHGSSYLEHLNVLAAVKVDRTKIPDADLQTGLNALAIGTATQFSVERDKFSISGTSKENFSSTHSNTDRRHSMSVAQRLQDHGNSCGYRPRRKGLADSVQLSVIQSAKMPGRNAAAS